VASTEQDKRLRAELAQELGFYPASLDPADVDRHRRLNAALDRAPTLDRIHRKSHTCGRRSDSTRPKPVAVSRWPTFTSEP
jgi:protein tyrosine/serine phosphatase